MHNKIKKWINTFSIKKKWNWPSCPKGKTPPLWPAEILLPNQSPKTLVFIPINTSNTIPMKILITTCASQIKPNTSPLHTKEKKKKKGKKNCQAIDCGARTCNKYDKIINTFYISDKSLSINCIWYYIKNTINN